MAMSTTHPLPRSRRTFGPIGIIALLGASLLLAGCGEGVLKLDDQTVADEETLASEDGPEGSFATISEIPLEPVEIVCIHKGDTPMLVDEALAEGFLHAATLRDDDIDEEDAGLESEAHATEEDTVELSASRGTEPQPTGGDDASRWITGVYIDLSWYGAFLAADSDGDCLTNGEEIELGTDYDNPDTDGDGWYDGACNERRTLWIEWIKAEDEQEDCGDDEFYVIVDDIRYPNGDLDDYWDYDDGDAKTLNRLVAVRTRGTNHYSQLKTARLEGWEDDVEITNIWTVDDLLFEIEVDMGAYSDGQTFTIRRMYDDWDYKVRFRVDVEKFADLNPLADDDPDGDGIRDSAEFAVARDFGGITDPAAQNILVEVDWMSGHGMRTNAKRLVSTQLFRHGYRPYIHRHQSLPVDGCLTRDEARNLYNTRFTFSDYRAFRYAVISEELWNDASGVAIGDTFFMDDSTWWINGGILAQGGTFIHELGHTLGLSQSLFHLIDTIAWFSYDSAMNYTFQATLVNYSGSGNGDGDFNDWAYVDPSHGLKYSFGLSTASNDGICN